MSGLGESKLTAHRSPRMRRLWRGSILVSALAMSCGGGPSGEFLHDGVDMTSSAPDAADTPRDGESASNPPGSGYVSDCWRAHLRAASSPRSRHPSRARNLYICRAMRGLALLLAPTFIAVFTAFLAGYEAGIDEANRGRDVCDAGCAPPPNPALKVDGIHAARECRVTRSRVFVTSTMYTADLGGVSGADAACAARANAEHLGGTVMSLAPRSARTTSLT
jgi:hypothetical protein